MAENWANLARAVRARRAELGISQATVQERGGPSDIVIGRIENNEKPRPRGDTLRKLDQGLGWEPGYSLSILVSPRTPGSVLAEQPTPSAHESEVNKALEWAERLVEAAETMNADMSYVSDEVESALATVLTVAMGLSAKGYESPPEEPPAPGLDIGSAERMQAFQLFHDQLGQWRKRSERADRIMNRVLSAVHVAATRTALAHGEEPPSKPPRLRPVPSMVDYRKVPPPPSLDGLDVAASRREKQSDRDPNLAWWVPPSEVAHPQATPGSVPDSIRAVVPKKVFREYAASVEGVRRHLKAVEDAAAEQRLTTATVTSLLNAIAAYATAARDFTSELRRVELDATPEQIDGTLPLFEQAERFAASLSRSVGHLLPAAPNTDESDRLIATQRSLAELEDFHRDAYDVWVETGRSSKSLKAIASRREEQSGGDRDEDDRGKPSG